MTQILYTDLRGNETDLKLNCGKITGFGGRPRAQLCRHSRLEEGFRARSGDFRS